MVINLPGYLIHCSASRENFNGFIAIYGKKRLPEILQSEQSECALACLAMVLSNQDSRPEPIFYYDRKCMEIKKMGLVYALLNQFKVLILSFVLQYPVHRLPENLAYFQQKLN